VTARVTAVSTFHSSPKCQRLRLLLRRKDALIRDTRRELRRAVTIRALSRERTRRFARSLSDERIASADTGKAPILALAFVCSQERKLKTRKADAERA